MASLSSKRFLWKLGFGKELGCNKINSIGVLLSLAANKWPPHQLDVENAFFNGDLQAEV